MFAVYYRPQRSCSQGNVFTPVCHSVHRGVRASSQEARLPPGKHAPPPRSTHPPRKHVPPSPGKHAPPGKHTPHGSIHPLEAHSPPPRKHAAHPPPQEADSVIRSMSGRYSSYWDSFLFFLSFSLSLGVNRPLIYMIERGL